MDSTRISVSFEALGLVAVFMIGSGCDVQNVGGEPSSERPPSPAVHSVSDQEQMLAKEYPPGRWRLAKTDDLSRIVLWVSHILIRHEAARPGISFQLDDWRPDPPASARTRNDAFHLAGQIAAQLRNHPENFEAVARQLSEDVASRDAGGSLGGLSASVLYLYPEVLDALAVVRPGETSRAVETAYGFHVFLRHAPPVETLVSGARVVIGYDEAPWLGAFLARRPIPPRPRLVAMTLAQQVYKRARSGEDFSALVDEYSDHEDAVRNGDFGEWSTREPTPFPQEIEILQKLTPGEVGPPIDTPFGFAVVKRTPPQSRKSYAMSTIRLGFEPHNENGPSSRNSVRSHAQFIAQSLRLDPSKFDKIKAEYCCTGAEQWVEGRGSARAEQALGGLLPGQVGQHPVEMSGAYAIIKREDTVSQRAVVIDFELPSPLKPDVAYLASEIGVNAQLSVIGRDAPRVLQLEAAIAKQFTALHELTGNADEAPFNEQRTARFVELQDKVRTLLGDAGYNRYSQFLEQFFERHMLSFLRDSRSRWRGRSTRDDGANP